ncbi:penicillin-binding protein 2, partial [Escherichia coli]|nr:penicillin-binding protein 2 [Escherichia coli]
KPRVAVAGIVEHGGGGSTAAAPIARDITLRALHDDLPPLSAYPAYQRNQIEERFRELDLRSFEENVTGRSRA